MFTLSVKLFFCVDGSKLVEMWFLTLIQFIWNSQSKMKFEEQNKVPEHQGQGFQTYKIT